MGRAWLFIPLAAMIVVIAGYTVYWNVVRTEARAIIETEAERLRTDGYTISWSDMSASGYPVRVTWTLKDASVTGPANAWSWGADAVDIHALPYRLSHVIATAPGAHDVTLPTGERLALTFAGAQASLSSDAAGVNRVSVNLHRAAATTDAGSEPAYTAEEVTFHLQRDPADAARYRVYAGAQAPVWPGAADGAPQEMAADAYIAEADRLMASGLTRETVAAWAAAGGALDLQDVRMLWPDSAIRAGGLVRVDPGGYLAGEVDVVSQAPAQALARLAALGLVDRRAAERAGLLLAATAGDEARVPIAFRDGGSYVLGLRLAPAPRVY